MYINMVSVCYIFCTLCGMLNVTTTLNKCNFWCCYFIIYDYPEIGFMLQQNKFSVFFCFWFNILLYCWLRLNLYNNYHYNLYSYVYVFLFLIKYIINEYFMRAYRSLKLKLYLHIGYNLNVNYFIYYIYAQ